MRASPTQWRLLALRQHVRRHVAVEVVEHRLDRLHRGFQVRVDLDIDQLAAFLDPGLLLRLVPQALVGQVLAQAQERFLLPGGLHFVLAAVAAGVVGGGVVVQAIGHEFDDAAALAAARAFVCAAHGFQHRDQVVAIHLQAMQAAGQAFLRQRLGARSAPCAAR
jgi:hypothetical protein